HDVGFCFAARAAAGDPQLLSRVRNGKAERPWPNDSVLTNNDRVIVGAHTDVLVRVDSTIARGGFALAPDLGRCPGSDVGRHILGRNAPTTVTGSYELKIDTTGRGASAEQHVILGVKNGAAVVQ